MRKATAVSGPRGSALLFSALADPNRLRLINRLASGRPLSITRLGSGVRITRQAVTKHLQLMERAGVVQSTRRGRERLWQLRQSSLQEARNYLNQISAQWDDALERLRAFVED
jgi:DNA-binding transcriptional ArsR family regulator